MSVAAIAEQHAWLRSHSSAMAVLHHQAIVTQPVSALLWHVQMPAAAGLKL